MKILKKPSKSKLKILPDYPRNSAALEFKLPWSNHLLFSLISNTLRWGRAPPHQLALNRVVTIQA
jgi:superfamily I DNA and/or RNA helicase